MSSGEDKRPTPHIIIVGAGVAGLSTAIQLKRQLHFENFTIYEKADAVGGTWRDNTYPGCGSDTPAHWYSLSTDLNPNWQSYYIKQPQIRAYWEDLYHKYDLPAHTKLGYAVKSAEWDAGAHCYTVTVQKMETGELITTEAEIMFYALGGFMAPTYPKDIAGSDKFCGMLWHSGRWRHDVNLAGKRIGVIGNGCSAAQFVPEISADPSVQVINFCRTPQWFVPRRNFHYPRWLQYVFARVPLVMRWYRNLMMAKSDIVFLVFQKGNTWLVTLARRVLTAYIKYKAPSDQVQNMIPTYAPGCKRIIVNPGYLECLNRPNVSLRWDGIDSIVEEGIRMKSGEVFTLDVIIFATGYSLEPLDLVVRGSKGSTIHEYYASKGGPTAYLGSYMPGFPNLSILLGPNVATGHASVIFSQESQISLALQLIDPVLDGQVKSFEVTDEATDKYNTWLQGRLSTSVWTDCNSYYQVGGQKQTKIIATFPGPISLFWWLCRTPQWRKFRGVGVEAWEKKRRNSQMKKWSLTTLFIALVVRLVFNGPVDRPAVRERLNNLRTLLRSVLV